MRSTPFIIPSETQAREFDAKLLLACTLAERGFRSFVGSRVEIHLEIFGLPQSIYVAKDFRVSSHQMFQILSGLGHGIVAWDEEGVVSTRTDIYHRKRVHAPTLQATSLLFAWGEDNAERIRSAPAYHGAPIEVSGNPRADMARPELRAYFEPDVRELRERYGDFILINTNFGKLNHHVPDATFVPGKKSTDRVPPNAFERRVWQHRSDIFKHFREMVPALARRFPEYSVIVRPHPSEDAEMWRALGQGLPNAHVCGDGNVQAWLLASRTMIHNGCTTGLEGFLLGVPVIAYEPNPAEEYDLHLTNDLSTSAGTLDELFEIVGAFARGARAPEPTAAQRAIVARTIAALDGPLACERIAAALERHADSGGGMQHPSLVARLSAGVTAQVRAAGKRWNAGTPGHKNSEASNLHRFPDMELAEVQRRVARLQAALGRFEGVRVSETRRNIFEVRPAV